MYTFTIGYKSVIYYSDKQILFLFHLIVIYTYIFIIHETGKRYDVNSRSEDTRPRDCSHVRSSSPDLKRKKLKFMSS